MCSVEGSVALLYSPRLLATAAVGALLLAGAVIGCTFPGPDEPAPPAEMGQALPQPSIAVLPFSLSGDEQPVANLSAGMTAELVRELARYSSVFVLGPQSVSRFGPADRKSVV